MENKDITPKIQQKVDESKEKRNIHISKINEN